MQVNKITIGGYKNIERTTLEMQSVIALISPNNYGKSNLLDGIHFGIDFLSASSKVRKRRMRYGKGVPKCKKNKNADFYFEIEVEEPNNTNYRYIKYGYSFIWGINKDIDSMIVDEWLYTRKDTSSKYLSLLKRQTGEYRKSRDTKAFRKLVLDDAQLSIDILSAIDDIEIYDVIETIKSINFKSCSALELSDEYIPRAIDSRDSNEEFDFGYYDIPRILYELRQNYPSKYKRFQEMLFKLFPEFNEIVLQSYTFEDNHINIRVVINDEDGEHEYVTKDKELEVSEPNGKKEIIKYSEERYKLLINTEYLSEAVEISQMSEGTKRIIWLLTNLLVAEFQETSIVGIEELETSTHPRLLKSLLEFCMENNGDSTLLLTSHSPLLIQYMKLSQIYIALPNKDGIADFKNVLGKNEKQLNKSAKDNGLSTGEYLFELMCGDRDSRIVLQDYIGGDIDDDIYL